MKPRTSPLHAATLLAGTALAALSAGAGAAETRQHPIVEFSTCAKPHWPAEDLKAKHTGTVTLRFAVSEAGTVTGSSVVKSSGFPGLDEAARNGIAQCRFKPAMAGDKAIAADVQVQYVWTLE